MNLTPIKKANVTEQVFAQIKKNIISGSWKPGARIPSENELTETLKVSRITVRQALQQLSALGLIETRNGEGSFVSGSLGAVVKNMVPLAYLGNHDIQQVLEFRKVIETESAAIAAQKATGEEVEILRQIYAEMQRSKDDAPVFAELDLQFHFCIAEITHNDLIVGTHTILMDVLRVAMKDIVASLGHEDGIRYHRELIAAIADHDSEKTRGLMAAHLDETSTKMNALTE